MFCIIPVGCLLRSCGGGSYGGCKVGLSSCCGRVSLKTGTLVIGIVHLVISLFVVLGSTVLLVLGNNGVLNRHEDVTTTARPTDKTYKTIRRTITTYDQSNTEKMSDEWNTLVSLYFVFGCIYLLFSTLLVVGAKGKPGFLVAFLIYSWIWIGLQALYVLGLLIGPMAPYAVWFAAWIGLQIYFNLVVKSFHETLTTIPYGVMQNCVSQNVTVVSSPQYTNQTDSPQQYVIHVVSPPQHMNSPPPPYMTQTVGGGGETNPYAPDAVPPPYDQQMESPTVKQPY
jgi:hypothetical protein